MYMGTYTLIDTCTDQHAHLIVHMKAHIHRHTYAHIQKYTHQHTLTDTHKLIYIAHIDICTHTLIHNQHTHICAQYTHTHKQTHKYTHSCTYDRYRTCPGIFAGPCTHMHLACTLSLVDRPHQWPVFQIWLVCPTCSSCQILETSRPRSSGQRMAAVALKLQNCSKI